jgi:pyrroline-5-carboxylate reductase
MAQQGDVAELRKQVTSPRGTTEQAIFSFQQDGLADLVDRATRAARDRSQELAKKLGKK